MRAIVYETFGAPEVLHLADLPKPSPGPHELLIRVRASTVTAADWRSRSKIVPPGLGLVASLSLGFSKPKHPVLGTELAGVVEAVGEQVTRFKVGDRVFAYPALQMGCHAEYRCVAEDGPVALTPPNLSDEEAAALCFGGVTALRFFAKAGGVQKGMRILINGASGGVGSAAVQLARHFGAQVTGVCSTAGVELVRSLGAEKVIDYTQEDFALGQDTYDMIVDCGGGATWSRCKHLLRPGGWLLLVIGDLGGAFTALTHKNVVFGDPPEVRDEIGTLARLAAAGAYRPVISQRYPLEQAVEAHRLLDQGHKKGNVVLTVN